MKEFVPIFYPFDKEIVELYKTLCETNGWQIVNRMHSLYFYYPNVTENGEGVWFITDSSLNTSIKNCSLCSFCMVEENIIKECFIEKFTLAMNDLSRRYVFIKMKNRFEYLGLFELIASDVEVSVELGEEILVKTYRKILPKN